MRKLGLIMALLVLGLGGKVAAEGSWTYADFQRLMQQSGRKTALTESQFAAVQARKDAYLKATETYITRSCGTVDPRVMKAFQDVPREYFMYNYEKDAGFETETHETSPHPWEIGYGSYLSDYRAQGYMTQVLQPKPTDVSLEIGTGSGFQTAILSQIVKEAYSIEIITPLGEKVGRIYEPLGYKNVHTRVGDGFFGWPEVKEPFDIIIVTCLAPYVPPPLLEQLKNGGRMIIPIGQPYKSQYLYLFWKDEEGKVHSRKEMPTFFIPMTGRAQQAQ